MCLFRLEIDLKSSDKMRGPISGKRHYCRNTIQTAVISDDSFSARASAPSSQRSGARERVDAETREHVGGNTNFQRGDTRSLSAVHARGHGHKFTACEPVPEPCLHKILDRRLPRRPIRAARAHAKKIIRRTSFYMRGAYERGCA